MRKIYGLFIIILIISIIYITNYKDKTLIVNGIKYRTTLNGKNVSTFPTSGNYEVTVECENAIGKWNYSKWVAEIYEITGSVTCNISFNDASMVSLSNHVINLEGVAQGSGKLVHEIYSVDAIFEYSDYTNVGNDSTYPFSWNGGDKVWTSTNKKNDSSADIEFKVNSTNEYEICYFQSSEVGCDYATIYKNGTVIKSLKDVEMTSTECLDLGTLSSSDLITVKYQKDGSRSSGNDSISFYLKYSNKLNTIDTGYRYEGKNPNNYIYFNDELWRIIGVFDSTSHGISNTNLVKIIRNESLGSIAFDTGVRDNVDDGYWTNSSLKELLNDYYYNSLDGTTSGYCCKFCEGVVKDSSNCDYTSIGIKEKSKNMIQENVTWYLGGVHSWGDISKYTVNKFYSSERNSYKTYMGTDRFVATGTIGLLYMSDYGYSVLDSQCDRNTYFQSYATNGCATNSWLVNEISNWTVTPNISTGESVCAYGLNDLGNNFCDKTVSMGVPVYPALYLKSNVVKYAGDGSISNPYQIRLEN